MRQVSIELFTAPAGLFADAKKGSGNNSPRYDLPEPDEVEYGVTCLRFYYNERKACVVFDLDPDAEDEPEELTG